MYINKNFQLFTIKLTIDLVPVELKNGVVQYKFDMDNYKHKL